MKYYFFGKNKYPVFDKKGIWVTRNIPLPLFQRHHEFAQPVLTSRGSALCRPCFGPQEPSHKSSFIFCFCTPVHQLREQDAFAVNWCGIVPQPTIQIGGCHQVYLCFSLCCCKYLSVLLVLPCTFLLMRGKNKNAHVYAKEHGFPKLHFVLVKMESIRHAKINHMFIG